MVVRIFTVKHLVRLFVAAGAKHLAERTFFTKCNVLSFLRNEMPRIQYLKTSID